MCLILFSWKDHPAYELVLAANRDEFYERETIPADSWEEHPNIIGGRDLLGGGTWLGINQETGRFAALTNYRDPANIKPDAPSRGKLTTDFITGEIGPSEYLNKIKTDADQYNGFNLLVGNRDSLWYFNNVNFDLKSLSPGTYGLSNAVLDTPWPKVLNGKRKMEFLKSNDSLSSKEIFPLLIDHEQAADIDLPNTGVPLSVERNLSPMYIEMKGYGTRCSTMILKTAEETKFVEKTHFIKETQEEVIKRFSWEN
ncbi:NRDE family protein [Reichenbachiella versicolor]|uniref:NRDE family protein n=1 Tax=Reichenbachiella versicolor TaxID=1821036 RepID=UPI000D6E24A7|nr:NRDE family protein [Reichenbachiella versicolor]